MRLRVTLEVEGLESTTCFICFLINCLIYTALEYECYSFLLAAEACLREFHLTLIYLNFRLSKSEEMHMYSVHKDAERRYSPTTVLKRVCINTDLI